ncbi:NAD-dependent epimerase/dehydratase family protein [Hyalangium gracile]|uniref:NAD-dependent epimerase/dehydratase family protein n=1 Tax=Hyalangium gracile TaxID=394092 RepID=UPI001CCA4791|nr:NAD-dependent epimerase/dehydratase family protein [Hyalangium gracile]
MTEPREGTGEQERGSEPTVVTGATGFLGRHLCAALVARGESVVAVGRDFSRFPPLVEPLCRKAVTDLGDARALEAACRGARAVIHGAALSKAWGRREDFVRVNVEGTRNVLEAARAAGVRRFVHISSSSVVFEGRDGWNLTEDAPLPSRFLGDYSETKARAEELVRAARGIETIILRPRGIFGPGDPGILPLLVARARAKRLSIIGSGDNVQDFTYVENVVHAALLARDAAGVSGRTYFITNGEPIRVWDFIRRALEGLGIAPPTRRVPLAVARTVAAGLEALYRLVPALGEPPLTRYTVSLVGVNQTLDITAARRELGYAPRVSLDEGLARTLAAFREEHA